MGSAGLRSGQGQSDESPEGGAKREDQKGPNQVDGSKLVDIHVKRLLGG